MTRIAQFPRWTIEVVRTVVILAIVLAVGTVYQARGDNHDTTYYACLYAGSLSQVGTTEPANCGRGTKISWVSGGQPGLTQAYDDSGLSNTMIVYGSDGSDEPTYLRSVDVPAGSYIVSATASFWNSDEEIVSTVSCAIYYEGMLDGSSDVALGPSGGPASNLVMPLQATVTLSEPGSIQLGCMTFDDSEPAGDQSPVRVFRSSLIAVPVSQVN